MRQGNVDASTSSRRWLPHLASASSLPTRKMPLEDSDRSASNQIDPPLTMKWMHAQCRTELVHLRTSNCPGSGGVV